MGGVYRMGYSPILAVVTAAFEILVAGWALAGHSKAESPGILRTTSAILLLLAGYQLAEVAICADVAVVGFLPRLAFIIVTWLPPLGLLLIAQLRKPRSHALRGSALTMLAAAAGIVVWIAVDRSFASASVCNAVYARYAHAMPRFLVYAWFYWLGLAGMILLSGHSAVTCQDTRRRQQLVQIFVGTTGFVALSMLTSWFVPPARGALPSIMCHFALLLAVCLACLVYLERRPAEEADASTVAQEG
jgi:hypothetical protein